MKKKIIFSIIMAFFLSLSFVCGTAFFVDNSSDIFQNQGSDQDQQETEVKATPSGDWSDYGANLEVGNQISVSGSYMRVDIVTAEELSEFARCVNNGSKIGDAYYSNASVYLQRDIDLSSHYWTPIGSRSGRNDFSFTGSFYGNSHTISGIFMHKTATDLSQNRYNNAYGLFGKTENALIDSLIIDGCYEFFKYSNEGNGTDELHIGSFVGNAKSTTMRYCYSYVIIRAAAWDNWNLDYIYAGGILGIASDCTVYSCAYYGDEFRFYSTGSDVRFEIWDTAYFGGLIGLSRNSLNISNSHNYSDIKISRVNHFYVAGLVSNAMDYKTKTITGCSNFGDIEIVQYKNLNSTSSIGGIIGTAATNDSNPLIINDCVNYGNITNSNASIENVGGIVGSVTNHSLIFRCLNYATINVQGNNVGGIVGKIGGSEWHMGVLGIGSWTEYYSHYLVANCINAGKMQGETNSLYGRIIGRITTDSSDLVNNVLKNNYFTDYNKPIDKCLNHDSKSVSVSFQHFGYKTWRGDLIEYSFLNNYNNWYLGRWNYNNNSSYRGVLTWSNEIGTHKMYESEYTDEDGDTYPETHKGTEKTWFMSPIVNFYFDNSSAVSKEISQTEGGNSLLVPSSAVSDADINTIQVKLPNRTITLSEEEKEKFNIKTSVRFCDNKGKIEWKSKFENLDSKNIYFLRGVNYRIELRYKQLLNLTYNTDKLKYISAEISKSYNTSFQSFGGVVPQADSLYLSFTKQVNGFVVRFTLENKSISLDIKTKLIDGSSSDFGTVEINDCSIDEIYYKDNIKYKVTPKFGYQFAGIAYEDSATEAKLRHGFKPREEPLGVYFYDTFSYEYQDGEAGQLVFLFKKVNYKIHVSFWDGTGSGFDSWTDFLVTNDMHKTVDFENKFELGYKYSFKITNLKSNEENVTLSDGDSELKVGLQPECVNFGDSTNPDFRWIISIGDDKQVDPFDKLLEFRLIDVNEFTVQISREAIEYTVNIYTYVDKFDSKYDFKSDENHLGGTVTPTAIKFTVDNRDIKVERKANQGYFEFTDLSADFKGYLNDWRKQNGQNIESIVWSGDLLTEYVSEIKGNNISDWNNTIDLYYFFSVSNYSVNLESSVGGYKPTFECDYKNYDKPYYFATVTVKESENVPEGYRYIGLYVCGSDGDKLLTLNKEYKFANNGSLSDVTITAKYLKDYTNVSGNLTAVNGVYEINNADDLIKLSQMVNGGETFESCLIRQTADINMFGKIFNPIGSEAHPFKGVYDGNHHMISNLKFIGGDNDGDKISDIGLFGYTNGATIKNLTIKDCKFTGFGNVGAVVAEAENTKFSYVHTFNCTLQTNKITYHNIYNDEDNGSFDYAENVVELQGKSIKNSQKYRSRFGGIVGLAKDCKFFAVSSKTNMICEDLSEVAGIVGEVLSSTEFSQCYAECQITANPDFTHDLACGDSDYVTSENCYYRASSNSDNNYYGANINNLDKDIWLQVNSRWTLKVFYWC